MITKQEIENIALLSKLYVEDAELETLAVELQKMINFADSLSKAETENFGSEELSLMNPFYREDSVAGSLTCEEILSNAPESKDNCFLLRKRV